MMKITGFTTTLRNKKTTWTAAALSLLPLQLYLSIVTMDMLLQHLLLHGVKQ
jgi:hypothetical protein